MPVPVILFAFRRPDELRRTLTALRANHLAAQSDLYVFVDGPRPNHPDEPAKVAAVRDIVDGLTGFRRIYRRYQPVNRGCANSVIAGVTAVLKNHSSVIVLEDDIVTES